MKTAVLEKWHNIGVEEIEALEAMELLDGMEDNKNYLILSVLGEKKT